MMMKIGKRSDTWSPYQSFERHLSRCKEVLINDYAE
jgi:hypothetical protein